MGAIKELNYKQRQIQLSNWTKALAHPARIAILEYLSQQDSCVCGEIVHQLDLSQSTVSQHLKALKEIGLIKGEIEGVKTCYCIDPTVWAQFKSEMNEFLHYINPSKNQCC